jgi:hypothetical protein
VVLLRSGVSSVFIYAQLIVRLLDVAILFAANAANVQRASEMLVGSVLFFNFRALFGGSFDRRCGFDWIYSFSLPRLGAARLLGIKGDAEAIRWRRRVSRLFECGKHVVRDIMQIGAGKFPTRHDRIERLSLIVDAGGDGAF